MVAISRPSLTCLRQTRRWAFIYFRYTGGCQGLFVRSRQDTGSKKPRVGTVAGRDFGGAPRYVSSGLTNLKVAAAKAPPKKLASRKIHILPRLENPMTVMPTATAGLNAPPEIAPTE